MQMKEENAAHFRDPLRILVGTVTGGDDARRLGAVEVRTPIGDDAAALLGRHS